MTDNYRNNYRQLETTAEMTIETILEEVEVGLGKENTYVILEGMTEAVVDQDHVKEPVHIETE